MDDKQTIVEFNNKTYTVNLIRTGSDEYTEFLANLDDWDEGWIEFCNQTEEIKEITNEHWKVIDELQDYHKKNGTPPMTRILCRVTGYPLKHIYELFPSGPKGACRMAGIPRPAS